jgi:acyl-CoA synthetase (AMP-forming)/AMP-acid ligase II
VPADSVLQALRRGADAGASFCVLGGEDQTLAELLEQIEARARGLLAAGLQPRERVGVALPNGTDTLLWLYAVIAAGGATVFIPPYAKPAEMRAYARAASTRWVIGSIGEPDAGFLTAEEARRRFAEDRGAALPEAQPDWEAGCFTTSGSTGSPKLAAVTHAGFDAQVIATNGLTGGPGDETCLFAMPLCHVALLPNVHAFLVQGGRVVHQTAFDAPAAMRAAAEQGAVYMSGSPAIYGLILQRAALPDPALRFRRVSYGAGAMPAHWAGQLGEALRCEVVHCYGLTEGGGVVSAQPPDEHASKPGTVGTTLEPFAPFRVRALGQERDCAVDEVGEVLVGGGSCMAGYVGDPQETARTMLDGAWVRTGDLGRLDADGDLWITGRLKDQINRGGLKIGAREVEVVIEALDGVQGVGVVGVPDSILGERVAAVIESEAALSAARVREACAQVLADHKVPERIQIVAQMPRTSLGKPDKPAIRRLLAEERSPA